MARLVLIGKAAHVELATENQDDEGGVIARCAGHVKPNVLDKRLDPACDWVGHYSSFDGALMTPWAERHADERS